MHLFFFVRGIQQQVDIWKIHAQCQYWQWKRINLKTKAEEIIIVQGALRPTILGCYEYVFPEECLAEVLAIMGADEGEAHYNLWKTRMYPLRKIMACEAITKEQWEEAKKISTTLLLTNSKRGMPSLRIDGVGFYPIGIKKDIRKKWEEIGYEQEML